MVLYTVNVKSTRRLQETWKNCLNMGSGTKLLIRRRSQKLGSIKALPTTHPQYYLPKQSITFVKANAQHIVLLNN